MNLINNVYRSLKAGGEFIFEFGGYGNNRLIHQALNKNFQKYGYEYQIPFYFPTISEYTSLLKNNGFLVRYANLFDRMTELKGPDGLKDWILMFVKTPFNIIENEKQKQKIIDDYCCRFAKYFISRK